MSNRTFYFANTLRKTNVAFMSLFKNIQVAKYAQDGTILAMRPVPLSFSHKQKFISMMLKQEKREYGTYLPRMGVTIKSITRQNDKNRGGQLAPLYKYVNNTGSLEKLFSGVPYTIGFTLSIVSMHMSEMSMILEQILPEFSPYKNITIKEFDFLPDFTRDIPVTLETVQPTFVEAFNQDEQIPRIECDLSFSMDIWIYRPILQSEIIKNVNIEIRDYDTENLYTTYNYSVSGDEL